jgi:hypothetical protein
MTPDLLTLRRILPFSRSSEPMDVLTLDVYQIRLSCSWPDSSSDNNPLLLQLHSSVFLPVHSRLLDILVEELAYHLCALLRVSLLSTFIIYIRDPEPSLVAFGPFKVTTAHLKVSDLLPKR